MNPVEKHLSPDEVEWLLEGRLAGGWSSLPSDEGERAAEHVAGCEPCRQLLKTHELAREEVRRSRAAKDVHIGDFCPSEREWWELAAGLASESRATELVERAIQCEACAVLLRDASEILSADTTEAESREIESLESSSEAWQRALAARLRGVERQATPVARPARRRVAFLLAAAAIAAVAFFGFLLLQMRTPSVDRLLAEAYSERRPVEVRIAGASHAPVRQQRSGPRSALSKPAALLRSEYLIKENLEIHPDDPFWLAAKGRAEILDWNYEEAIRSLSQALEAAPESPELLRDLATAHFQRAEAEGRPTDYGRAVELLGRALATQPNDPVSLFNRAIASERFFAFEQAIADWERYLQLDPEGDWAREANQRLEAVRRHLDRSSAPEIVEDPDTAIRRLEGGPRESLDDYLDVALTRWLPRLQQPSERRAVSLLAEALVTRHGDTWLRDVLSHPPTRRLQEGLSALAEAVRLREEGRFDDALARANDAKAVLSREECAACVLRARWETAYALQRGQRGRDCLEEASSAFDSTPRDYLWLRTQLLLETTACSLMVGELDRASHSATDALRLARTTGYELLLLRSLYFAGVAVGRDDPSHAWSYFFEGLSRHWSGTYRPFMVYQFYAEMAYTPEREGEWHLASTLSHEAVTHMSRTPNRLVEAMARHYLGVVADLAGDPVLAEKELARAARLFDSLPPSAVNRTFRFSADVYRASLESQDGRPDVALDRLISAAPPNPRDISQYWIWLHFYRTLGQAFLREDRVEEAERAIRAALSISEMALGSLSGDRDRTLWERQSGQIYRTLVELELARGDSDRALEVMEWYRAAPLRETGFPDVAVGVDFSSLASTAALPPMRLVRDTLPTLSDASVVSYARLSSGLFAWVFDDRGVQASRLASSSEEIDRLARRFHRLCSDPTSDIEEVREVGGELFRVLLGPFHGTLEPHRTLVIQPDGPLSQIAFQALLTPQGEFVGERFRVAYSPGLAFWPRAKHSSQITNTDRALVIGTSAGARAFGAALPPLPHAEDEARAVAGHFQDPAVLLGPEATLSAFRRELPRAVVFHFAGHAVARSNRSGLVLPGDADEAVDATAGSFLDASGIANLGLKNMKLVVLAACSTAGGPGLADPENLARAFVRAGVPHVVASRWDVDSRSTHFLMETLYERLGEGHSVDALKVAVDTIRKRPETGHPYYWAAFSIYGRS